MAINISDFNKIWASTSPLTPYSFSDANYQQGWNFVGATPPARQMWDYIQKNNDEKAKYIVDNFLPLSGGTLTGNLLLTGNIFKNANNSRLSLNGGDDLSNGAYLNLYGKDHATNPGLFSLTAFDGISQNQLMGNIDGTLTWMGKSIERVNASGTNYIRYENGIQICWGNNIAFDSSGTAINLPVAFKDATYGLVTVGKGLASSTNCAITKLSGKTTTTFTVVAVATSNISAFTSGNIDYVAIGLWK